MTRTLLAATCAAALAAACGGSNGQSTPAADTAAEAAAEPAARAADGRPFAVEQVTRFDEPWAMTFLPDGRLLVTEKPGTMRRSDVARHTHGSVRRIP